MTKEENIQEEKDKEENDQEGNAQDEINKLKIGYDFLQKSYSEQVERLKTADEKLNMFLVFNSAILALLTIVFPLPETRDLFIVSIIMLALFISSMLTTIIIIVIAALPKKIKVIDNSNFIEEEFYKCTPMELLGKIMAQKKGSIDALNKFSERKHKCGKAAMLFSLINIGLMIPLILISII